MNTKISQNNMIVISQYKHSVDSLDQFGNRIVDPMIVCISRIMNIQ